MTADKHLKDLYGHIGEQISNNSLYLEMVNDIGKIGSVSSNFNSCQDYGKYSSEPKLVLTILKIKNNHILVIGNLNINSISNKLRISNNLKLKETKICH